MARTRATARPRKSNGGRPPLPGKHKCSICGGMRDHSSYPFAPDSSDRVLATCIDCLSTAGLFEEEESTAALGGRKLREVRRNQDDDSNDNDDDEDIDLEQIDNQGYVEFLAELEQVGPGPALEDRLIENGESEIQEDVEMPDVQEEQPAPQANVPKRKSKRRRSTKNYFAPRKRVKKPTLPPPTHFTCRICVDEKPVNEFLEWQDPRAFRMMSDMVAPPFCISHLSRPLNQSLHREPICKECIGRTFAAALETVGADHIVCPEPTCKQRWDTRFVLNYLPSNLHEAYNEDLFALFWSRAYKVTCPIKDCGVMAYVDHQKTPGFPHVECNSCETRICALCLVPWHKDLTCQQYRAKNHSTIMESDEMKTLRALAKQGAKRCPRCQMAIEKDGGCDSMYCQHCEVYFDWARAEPVLGVRAKSTFKPNNEALSNYYHENCELDDKAQAALAPPPPPPPPPADFDFDLMMNYPVPLPVPPPGMPPMFPMPPMPPAPPMYNHDLLPPPPPPPPPPNVAIPHDIVVIRRDRHGARRARRARGN